MDKLGGTCIVHWCFPFVPCDRHHERWQLDTPVNTTNGQRGVILQWVHIHWC